MMKNMQLTPKQIKFAQTFFETDNRTAAYRSTYSAGNMNDNSVNKEVCLLLKHPKIQTYLSTLRSTVEKEVVKKLANEDVYDRIAAARDVENAYAIAQAKNNPAAMIAAVQLKSKLYGLIVDKAEVKTSAIDELSDRDSLAVLNALNAINKARQLP